MAHQAETHSPARSSLAAEHARRKRIILLCSEELRFVACGLEAALASRGWSVRVEYGEAARPWIQTVPIERPSLRVLCVPGTVDRELADKLREAYAPAPDADLHILGVDDSRGLVQEIERMAGVRTPGRRPLSATPRLSHSTLVETAVQTQRSWRVGAVAAIAAFGVLVGGGMLLDDGARPAQLSGLPAAGLGAMLTEHGDFTRLSGEMITTPRVEPPQAQPVLSNVQPYAFEEAYELDPLPPEEEVPEEDFLIIIDDDEPTESTTSGLDTIGAPPLDVTLASASGPELGSTAISDDDVTKAGLQLPTGFLPVGGLTVSGPAATLPVGFLPVAGLDVRPGADPVRLGAPAIPTYDPFAVTTAVDDPTDAAGATSSAPTVYDPFVSST